jgi:hypothetical protein
VLPWILQRHNDYDPNSGQPMGDYFEAFPAEEARAQGLTLEALRARRSSLGLAGAEGPTGLPFRTPARPGGSSHEPRLRPQTDSLDIHLCDSSAADSDEVADGIVLDFDVTRGGGDRRAARQPESRRPLPGAA